MRPVTLDAPGCRRNRRRTGDVIGAESHQPRLFSVHINRSNLASDCRTARLKVTASGEWIRTLTSSSGSHISSAEHPIADVYCALQQSTVWARSGSGRNDPAPFAFG